MRLETSYFSNDWSWTIKLLGEVGHFLVPISLKTQEATQTVLSYVKDYWIDTSFLPNHAW